MTCPYSAFHITPKAKTLLGVGKTSIADIGPVPIQADLGVGKTSIADIGPVPIQADLRKKSAEALVAAL